MDNEGNVVEESYLKALRTKLSNTPWLLDIIEEALPKCLEEAKQAERKKGEQCSPVPFKITMCLYKEIQFNCPADEIKDVKLCNLFRERLLALNNRLNG